MVFVCIFAPPSSDVKGKKDCFLIPLDNSFSVSDERFPCVELPIKMSEKLGDSRPV